eukprot:Opistho-1_new@70631
MALVSGQGLARRSKDARVHPARLRPRDRAGLSPLSRHRRGRHDPALQLQRDYRRLGSAWHAATRHSLCRNQLWRRPAGRACGHEWSRFRGDRTGQRTPVARALRLADHRRLHVRDAGRRLLFLPRRQGGLVQRVLPGQPVDPGLGGGNQHVRGQHQLDQLPRHSRQGLRDQLAVYHVEDVDDRRPDLRRDLDRAPVPAAQPGVGVQLSRDPLPPLDPPVVERAMDADADRRAHGHRPVPASDGDRHDHRHQYRRLHHHRRRLHDHLHRARRHEGGGVDRRLPGDGADRRRVLRDRLHRLPARPDADRRYGARIREDRHGQFELRHHPANAVGLPHSRALRRRAHLPQGSGTDAARTGDTVREGSEPVGLGIRGGAPAQRLHVLHHRHRAVRLLSGEPRTAEPDAADRRGVPGLYRYRTARRDHRPDHRRSVRRRDGYVVGHHQFGRDFAVGRFLRQVPQPDTGADGALRRMDERARRPDRHRYRDHPFPDGHPFAAGSYHRAVRPARRQLRGRLHARHVHPPRQLAGRRDRHRRRVAADFGRVDLRPDPSLLVSGARDHGLDRDRLSRQPVLPPAKPFAGGTDHLRQGA